MVRVVPNCAKHHTFAKINSPCNANWFVKKTAKGQTKSYSKRAIESILEHFYMGDFLDSFSSQAEAINLSKEISEILKKGDSILLNSYQMKEKF